MLCERGKTEAACGKNGALIQRRSHREAEPALRPQLGWGPEYGVISDVVALDPKGGKSQQPEIFSCAPSPVAPRIVQECMQKLKQRARRPARQSDGSGKPSATLAVGRAFSRCIRMGKLGVGLIYTP